jgi:hypothetical protein
MCCFTTAGTRPWLAVRSSARSRRRTISSSLAPRFHERRSSGAVRRGCTRASARAPGRGAQAAGTTHPRGGSRPRGHELSTRGRASCNDAEERGSLEAVAVEYWKSSPLGRGWSAATAERLREPVWVDEDDGRQRQQCDPGYRRCLGAAGGRLLVDHQDRERPHAIRLATPPTNMTSRPAVAPRERGVGRPRR